MGEEMRHLRWVLVIVIAGAVLAAFFGFVEINLEGLDTEDLLTLFLTVIFVALIIERAVEVYANNRFDPEFARIKLTVSVIESNLAFKEDALKRELAGENPRETTVNDLRDRIVEARQKQIEESEKIAPELAAMRCKKASYAAALATILGLAASIVGVRVLGQFLPSGEEAAVAALGRVETGREAAEIQLATLRFVDVVLTTALLAGGADGIHNIIKRFTDIRAGR